MNINDIKVYRFLISMPYYKDGILLGYINNIYKEKNYFVLVIYNEWYEPKHIYITPQELISLLEQYKLELIKEERREVIEKRGIENLVHFTNLINVPSILEYGLWSRDSTDMLFDSSSSDDMRKDGFTDYVNTSITFPNYKMFYSKRKNNPTEDWAVLTIDPNVLINNLDVLFFKQNASNHDMQIDFYNNPYYFKSALGLESLFEEENRNPYLPLNYPTNPQAEVLIGQSVGCDSITGVYTWSPKSKRNESEVLSLCREKNIQNFSSPKYFNPRFDFSNWKSKI